MTIHPQTKIGAVALTVPDLQKSVEYYTRTLGMRLISGPAGGEAVLGAGDEPLVRLREAKGARRVAGTPGLYHMAIRVPDRKALARELVQLAQSNARLQGVADHGVSEALYLADPDRNGIEIYRDRPEDDWPVNDADEIEMYTDPLDLEDLLQELSGESEGPGGLPAGTVMGHVHLQVTDLASTEQFYTQVLGFDLMQRYGDGALFFSAGGYHHHVGANTWASKGAAPAPEGSAGLRYFELKLPDAEARAALIERARAAGAAVEESEAGALVKDPSGNGILI